MSNSQIPFFSTVDSAYKKLNSYKESSFYDESKHFPEYDFDKLIPLHRANFFKETRNANFVFINDVKTIIETQIQLVNQLSRSGQELYLRMFAGYIKAYYCETNVKLYRYALALLLAIMNETKTFIGIFYHFSDENDSEPTIISENFQVLFNEKIFPINPIKDCEFGFIECVNQILYEWILSVDGKSREILYNEIEKYSFSDDKKTTIYNFIPLLSMLLSNPKESGLYTNFKLSKLFEKIIHQSLDDLLLFDFVRFFIKGNPCLALIGDPLSSKLTSYYFNNKYCHDVSTVIGSLFFSTKDQTDENRDLEKDIISIIDQIINQCVEKSFNSQTEEIYTTILGCFPHLSDCIIQFILDSTKIFDNLAIISITSLTYFRDYLSLITQMCIKYYSFVTQIASRGTIYSTLKKYNSEEPEISIFTQFMFCCSVSEINSKFTFIRNYKAVELLLYLLPIMLDKESEIIHLLTDQTANSGNILELSKAKMPVYILERLSSIKKDDQSMENIVVGYLKLLRIIISHVFDNSMFYNILKIIKNPDFEFTKDIFEIIDGILHEKLENNNIIKDSNHVVIPDSFFRLDRRNGGGIFGPVITKDFQNNFSIYFSIRLNSVKELQQEKFIPLIYMISDKPKTSIGIVIKNDKITLIEEVDKAKPIEKDICQLFEIGQWNYIQIYFSKSLWKKTLSISINNAEPKSVDIANWIFTNFTFYFGSQSENSQSTSLICDFSNIILVNGNEKITQQMLHSSNINTSLSLVAIIDPSNCHEGFCFGVNSKNAVIKYCGHSIPFIPDIVDTFKTIGSIINLLPLIEHKEKTNEENSQYIILLLHIFEEVLKLSPQMPYMYRDIRFFELLSSFLYGISRDIFNFNIVIELFSFFLQLKEITTLKYEMAKYIILNYPFIMRLRKEVYEKWFSELVQKVITNEEDDYYHYSMLPSVLHYTCAEYFRIESTTADNAWTILQIMFIRCLSIVNEETTRCEFVITLIKYIQAFQNDIYFIEKALQVILNLLNKSPEHKRITSRCLKKSKILETLLSFFSQPHTSTQILTFEIICIIKECLIDIDSVIFKINSNFYPEYETIDNLTKVVYQHLCIDQDGIIKINVEYLPFLNKCFEDSDKKQTVSPIIDSFHVFMSKHPKEATKIFSIPCWTELMTELYMIVYDPVADCKSFSLPFEILFEEEFQRNDVSRLNEYFYYLDLSADKYKFDSRNLKLSILSSLLHGNILSNEHFHTLLNLVFNFLIFDKTTKQEKGEISSHVQLRKISKITDEEKEVVQTLIQMTSGNNGNIVIGGSMEINSLVGVSILASLFLRQNLTEYVGHAETISKHFTDQNLLTAYKCSKILTSVVQNQNDILEKFTFLTLWLQKAINSNCKVDENEEIISLISKMIPSFMADYAKCISDVYIKLKNDLDKFNYKTDDQFTEQSICQTLADQDASKDSKFIKNLNESFKFENSKLQKLKNSFITSLSNVPGIWENHKSDRKYKAFNFISRRGQRILMKINKNFDCHADAVSNFDASNHGEVAKYVQYQTLKSVEGYYKKGSKYLSSLQCLLMNYNGELQLTDQQIIFSSRKKHKIIQLSDIVFVMDRRINHEELACEIFTTSYQSYFFIFESFSERTRFYDDIDNKFKQNKELMDIVNYTPKNTDKFEFFSSLRSNCHSIHQNKPSSHLFRDLKLDTLWQTWKLTNYEYIYYLNLLGGRSFNDPLQYPIFPVLILDCNSDKLDILKSTIYRDLSLPPIKLSTSNYESKIKCFEGTQGTVESLIMECPSTDVNVASTLLRVEPFTSLQIQIQTIKINGKTFPRFDHIDRQIYSIEALMTKYTTNGSHYEAIPEFFTFPYMCINENQFDFGFRTCSPKTKIDNIILPNWSLDNHYVFIAVNRIALECKYTSENLHKWIDLYFSHERGKCDGYQLYPNCTYPEQKSETNKDDTNIDKTSKGKCIIGCLPSILYQKPHKPRDPLKFASLINFPQLKNKYQVISIQKQIAQCNREGNIVIDLRNNLVNELIIPVTGGKIFGASRVYNFAAFLSTSDPFITLVNLTTKDIKPECRTSSLITSATVVGSRFIITGAIDCSIKIWTCSQDLYSKSISTQLVSSSGFHPAEIVAIGGCYENGLIVSVDIHGNVIYETMFKHIFIASLKLNKEKFNFSTRDLSRCKILVFKSGTVAISLNKTVLLYDSHGKLIRQLNLSDRITDIKKYYDYDRKELMLIGYMPNHIDIFDLTTFQTIVGYEKNNCQFCPQKNARAFITADFDGFDTVCFAEKISSDIEKIENVERIILDENE
ncbi:hypothetical protein TRFO_04761 [Tritrichomonas foetus]|uniref:BEACH domain-containing protein n=1 Tax=Tritrichomonas foetus TaxID=1144522 RepID=A0A1J4KBT8_9EUKA|nr:hypothetical protein TRFO_04761 [Tritrichomonas foetus]|eukprot:OHT08691.1 hypothetical protein TRFO_04761 [Tritrichomonas foetus]